MDAVRAAPHKTGRRAQRHSIAAMTGAVAATVAIAACGGSDHKRGGGASSSAATSSATAIKPGKPGGKLTVLWADDVDFLDPGQTYYSFGYMVQYAVNRTLYSYKPDDSGKPIADLATGQPGISPDNRTITVHIKRGVKYAPPVNREVKSADIKYAFERAFSKECPAATLARTSARSSVHRRRPTPLTSSRSRASRRPTTPRSSFT
jgi:ABC-type transport system substrate-binding protein